MVELRDFVDKLCEKHKRKRTPQNFFYACNGYMDNSEPFLLTV